MTRHRRPCRNQVGQIFLSATKDQTTAVTADKNVCPTKNSTKRHRGFTLVEAMVALTITGLASSALLLSLASNTQSTDNMVRSYIAAGIAQTYMDEISGMRYMELGASPWDSALTAGSDEKAAAGRSIYDDLDDFDALRYTPPVDRNGQTLGNENGDLIARDPRFRIPTAIINNWRAEIDVFYVNENAWLTPLADTAGTNYRTAQVRIYYVPTAGATTEMSRLSRTFAYIPEP